MFNRSLVGLMVAACIVAFPLQTTAQAPTEKQMAESAEAQKHIASAMALARTDLVEEAKAMCTPEGPRRPAVLRQLQGLPPEPQQVIESTKIFDNLYYIGFNTVGAFALTTSDGIILIDSLNTPQEAADILVPSLRKLGLDPAQIKYVIVQHGHFDHFGGASYLQEQYKARVAMATEDWNVIERQAQSQQQQQRRRPLPKRDIELKHGDVLTLGDTTVTMALTPGHTPGSLALFFPVKYRGSGHMAMVLSLTTPDQPTLEAFEVAVNQFARKFKVAARLTQHLSVENVEWLAALRKNPAGRNGYIYDEAIFNRYMDIMVECARARVAAMKAP